MQDPNQARNYLKQPVSVPDVGNKLLLHIGAGLELNHRRC